jgi:t-SNARE complex subunit (syntaxin)
MRTEDEHATIIFSTIQDAQSYLIEYQEYIQKRITALKQDDYDLLEIVNQQLRDMTSILDDYSKVNCRRNIKQKGVQKFIQQYEELRRVYLETLKRPSSQQKKKNNNTSNNKRVNDAQQRNVSVLEVENEDDEDDYRNTTNAIMATKIQKKNEIDYATRSMIDINYHIAVERQQELDTICEDLVELNGIMHTMNQLVVEQGHNIQLLEDNIEDTHNNVVKGNKNLNDAEEYQKQTDILSITGKVTSWIWGSLW